MSANPWMKFYPSDWRSDPRLRMCSLAARGLWMEMLALMHDATPYGHLLVGGIVPSVDQLALLAGAAPAEVGTLLGQLEGAGVFSRTGRGVIYSRRMVADEKKARLARKNGAKGGNPTLCKTTENPPPDNGPDNGGDKTQSPEARYQNGKSEDDAGAHVQVREVVNRVAEMSGVPVQTDEQRRRCSADVAAWLASGADPDIDIFPAVADAMNRTPQLLIRTFRYFTAEIETQYAARLERAKGSTNVEHIGQGRQRRKPDAGERNDAFMRAIAREAKLRMDARSAGAGGSG